MGGISATEPGWRLYVDTFRAAAAVTAGPQDEIIDEPGIIGRVGTATRPDGRLLISDDRALPRLRALGEPWADTVKILSHLHECRRHVRQLGYEEEEEATAMVAPDLNIIDERPLDPGLVVRRAVLHPTGEEVALVDAAAACQFADAAAADLTLDGFVDYLSSAPNAAFLAAVDVGGTVRATAASALFGGSARVFFVSTDPAWRGRGVATAMTGAALRSARERGAVQASLDATPAGRGIYERLGLHAVAQLAMFGRPA